MFHYNVNWNEYYKGQYSYQAGEQFNDISTPGSNDSRRAIAIARAQELVTQGKAGVEVVELLHGTRAETKVWPVN